MTSQKLIIDPLSVTGCSSGLGKQLAQIARAKGHRVAATARKLEDLDYFSDDDSSVLKLLVDVTSKGSIDDAIKLSLSRFGRLDVVVNNAGYSLRGDTENASEQAARHLVETMFWGTVHLTRHAMRIMREENSKNGPQGGVVLNVSSMGGRVAFAGNAFYHAAKFAIEGFTESVSKEVRPDWNIHFSLIEPGGVKTDYATRSMISISPHPAYSAPDTPARILEQYMKDPNALKNWADVDAVANAMYSVVASGKEIPLRIPLGPDAWGMLKAENERNGQQLEQYKELSVGVGNVGQFEAIGFLRNQK